MNRTCLAILALSFVAFAQTQAPKSIQASGSATISGIQPDEVRLSVGVVTSAKTAQEAAAQNATRTAAVIAALQGALSGHGTVETISYMVTPQYSGGGNGAAPAIRGYTASNTVQVTTGNLKLAGPLVDAASAAGANQVNGPAYSLRDPETYRQQALAAAARQALQHAAAIAAGLGAKTGAVISAQETVSAPSPRPFLRAEAMAVAGTPIETETLSISANVTVTVALVQ